jgi:hypothetical protein
VSTSLLPLAFFLLTSAQSQPIIVKLVEPKTPGTGVADILIGALGLSGVLFLIAITFGVLVAGVLFLIRSRHPLK